MASLVDTDWMAAHLDDPGVRLVEIDWDGLAAYEAGHIPRAIGWNWKAMLWDPLMRDFPSDAVFRERMESAGIGSDTTVVFYGAPVQFGTYAWWVLKHFDHKDVRMLDGGLVKWQAEGRLVTTDVPDVPRGVYATAPRRDELRAGRDDVLEAIESGGPVILDHRSIEEYSGQRVGLPGKPDTGAERYGRIPGARHVPFDTLLNEDTSFKPVEEIRAIIGAAAADPGQSVISYCRLAHRATLAGFAMTELLGYRDVRIYDGSWTEWGSIVGVPIER